MVRVRETGNHKAAASWLAATASRLVTPQSLREWWGGKAHFAMCALRYCSAKAARTRATDPAGTIAKYRPCSIFTNPRAVSFLR
jgi:hypothetical protein